VGSQQCATPIATHRHVWSHHSQRCPAFTTLFGIICGDSWRTWGGSGIPGIYCNPRYISCGLQCVLTAFERWLCWERQDIDEQICLCMHQAQIAQSPIREMCVSKILSMSIAPPCQEYAIERQIQALSTGA